MAPPAEWTGPAELRAAIREAWERGGLASELLAAGIAGEPRAFGLRGPKPALWASRFDDIRQWIAGLQAAAGPETAPRFRLAWREHEHRQLGRNRVPVAAEFASLDAALDYAGLSAEARRLRACHQAVCRSLPELAGWAVAHPKVLLGHEADWPALLACLAWFKEHPRPDCHPRQVDAPGVHSKFIEANRGLLAELLDLVLPPAAIEAGWTGARQFNRRYGLRDKPVLVRLRFLDPGLAAQAWPGLAPAEISLRPADLTGLGPLLAPGQALRRVIVTENETNYLALPALPGGLAILGAGYGFDALADAAWLEDCELAYWGDLDTHGFAILHQFRQSFPKARSILMDEATLLAHRPLWGTEPAPNTGELANLDTDERWVYEGLRDQRYGQRVRLEQERIGFAWIERALAGL
jgi:hypothetical protein